MKKIYVVLYRDPECCDADSLEIAFTKREDASEYQQRSVGGWCSTVHEVELHASYEASRKVTP